MDALIFKKPEFKNYPGINSKASSDIYISNKLLDDAIEVAFMLNQPLLLTGEPGTGKTTLGRRVAHELHRHSGGEYAKEPLYFSTKSTSLATDLFYVYDAISHFQEANLCRNIVPGDTALSSTNPNPKGVSAYIKLQALGKAILSGNRDQIKDDSFLMDQLPALNSDNRPSSFVVVIDEIDKATRDFPNDLLYEIETFSFRIKELGNKEYRKSNAAKIFVILTSNSEKLLPEAFLRRCIFHHIEFPDFKILRNILSAHQIRYSSDLVTDDAFISECIGLFSSIREKCTDKKPATAELINWVRFLAFRDFDFDQPDREVLKASLSIIVKSRHDLKLVSEAGLLQRQS